jgi:hypothetical protein
MKFIVENLWTAIFVVIGIAVFMVLVWPANGQPPPVEVDVILVKVVGPLSVNEVENISKHMAKDYAPYRVVLYRSLKCGKISTQSLSQKSPNCRFTQLVLMD